MFSFLYQNPLKTVSLFLTLVLILSLIPMLAISFYARPALDDYMYGQPIHDAFLETNSVFSSIIASFRAVVDTYFSWQGSYTIVFLFGLQPGVFGEGLYWISPVLSIVLFVVSNLFFFHAFLHKLFGVDRRSAYCVSLLHLLLTMQLLPDGAQGFYWHTGATAYLWMYCLSQFLAGMLVTALLSEKSSKKIYYILCPLTAFLLAGCNYSTILLVLLLLVFYCGILLLLKKKEPVAFLTFAFYLGGFLISVIAPGNGVRMSDYNVHIGPIAAILQAMLDTLQLISEWTTLPFILLEICILPLLLPTIRRLSERFSFRLPLLPVILSYLLVAAGLTPLVYGYGEISTWAGRVFNSLFFMYALLFMLCLAYFAGWIMVMLKNHAKADPSVHDRSIHALTGFIPAFLTFALVCALIYSYTPMRKESYYELRLSHIPAISATATLMNGDAKGFAEEMDARLPVLYDASQPSPRFAPLTHRPYLLLVQDIDSNPGSWVNVMWDQYYHKDGIALDS